MGIDTLRKNILLFPFNLLYKISPRLTLKALFRLKQGYLLNLKNPVTFNQKLQWMKLYDRNPLMAKCCDKYAVREYVQSCGCGEILNELYWQGFDPEEIPFDSLPDQFVIKVTHGSTFNIIVTNKKDLVPAEVTKKLSKWLNSKFIPCYGEWFYGKVKPSIVVEKYLENAHDKELFDYKVFCFNGKAKLVDVHRGRFGEHLRNVYDLDWNFQPEVFFKYNHAPEFARPKVLPQLIEYAEILAEKFLHARVDFFIVDDRIYFAEFAFTNGAGFDHIKPYSFDEKMGSWLKLPIAEEIGQK